VKVLIHTGVANYMEFKPVDGSYVYSSKAGKVCKVPSKPQECMSSSLMGMMEKSRMVQLVMYVNKVKLSDRATWKAGIGPMSKNLALDTMTGDAFFKYWAVEKGTIEFLTHSCCLYRDNSYGQLPAIEIVKRMQLYLESMTRFPNMTSPYLYPLYGLGELPQAFARLAAVHGGVYMLNRANDDGPVFGDGKFTIEYTDGNATGVKVMDTVAKAKMIVADPTYFPDLCKPTGSVVRAIAIVSEPVGNTNNASSYQIIFPGASVGRVNDLYLFCCSAPHKVAPEGKYLVFVSTNVEGPKDGMSAEAVANRELSGGLAKLTGVVRIFYDMYDMYAPKDGGETSKVFLTESFDPTSHFETAIKDVLDVYKRIMGKPLVLTDGPASSNQ